jgi:hypothetical protein
LSPGRGLLIKSSNHRRDNTLVIDKLQEITINKLGKTASAEQFLTSIRKEKRRYVRDQFQLLASVAETYSDEIVQKAMNECLRLKLISAVSCRDIAQFIFQTTSAPLPEQLTKSALPSNSITPMIQTEHRQIAAICMGVFHNEYRNRFCYDADGTTYERIKKGFTTII